LRLAVPSLTLASLLFFAVVVNAVADMASVAVFYRNCRVLSAMLQVGDVYLENVEYWLAREALVGFDRCVGAWARGGGTGRFSLSADLFGKLVRTRFFPEAGVELVGLWYGEACEGEVAWGNRLVGLPVRLSAGAVKIVVEARVFLINRELGVGINRTVRLVLGYPLRVYRLQESRDRLYRLNNTVLRLEGVADSEALSRLLDKVFRGRLSKGVSFAWRFEAVDVQRCNGTVVVRVRVEGELRDAWAGFESQWVRKHIFRVYGLFLEVRAVSSSGLSKASGVSAGDMEVPEADVSVGRAEAGTGSSSPWWIYGAFLGVTPGFTLRG